MRNLCVMTWNTGLYLESSLKPTPNKYKDIINCVKKYLEKQNSICFLQEIPYFSNETWAKHTLFLQLEKDFPRSNYDIIYNVSSKKQIMMTIAIAKKGEIEMIDKGFYNSNRIVTIKCRDIQITGLHLRSGKDNKAELEKINNCTSDIILGDFNAGNYVESENRITFNRILKNYVCICNIPTRIEPLNNRRMCIDHIFVKENMVTRCINMIVHENAIFLKLSDHLPLTFEVIMEN